MKNLQENKNTEIKETSNEKNTSEPTNHEHIRESYPANIEGTKEFIKASSSDDIWDNHQGDIVHW